METIYGGLKVLELAEGGGMLCGKLLAAMGAQVLKVERPKGDKSRFRGPFGKGDAPENSLSFAFWNLGKSDITLDLNCEKGREVFRALIKKADILVETTMPGQLAQWGLDYSRLSKENPGLIMASLTPFGQSGPRSSWRAESDLIVDAMGGCMSDVGYIGRPPLHLGYDVLSQTAALCAMFGVQAAYYRRLRTGEGAHIDVSMEECLATWRSQAFGFAQVDEQNTPLAGGEGYVHQGTIKCTDGYCFMMIGGKWNELLEWFAEKGIDTAVFDDPIYQEHIYEVLTPWDEPLRAALQELGSHYSRTEMMVEGQRRRIPVASMETADSLLDNEQFKARSFFVEVDHPVLGPLQYAGAPAIMTESPFRFDRPAPMLGADNSRVLGALGLSAEEIAEASGKGA